MSLNAFLQNPSEPSAMSANGCRTSIRPKTPKTLVFSLFLLATMASSGCIHSSSATSSAKITATSLSTDAPLHVGDLVKLQVEVAHALNEDTGTVSLVVETADNSWIVEKSAAITKGSGKTTLETEFVVPETTTIQVFTPVAASAQTSTSIVDMLAFHVEPK